MSRYNLSDIQSSTVLYASDSIDEMIDVVQTLIDRDGQDALAGFSLSVKVNDSETYVEFDNAEIARAGFDEHTGPRLIAPRHPCERSRAAHRADERAVLVIDHRSRKEP